MGIRENNVYWEQYVKHLNTPYMHLELSGILYIFSSRKYLPELFRLFLGYLKYNFGNSLLISRGLWMLSKTTFVSVKRNKNVRNIGKIQQKWKLKHVFHVFIIKLYMEFPNLTEVQWTTSGLENTVWISVNFQNSSF